jgi:hypothetical protein
VLDGAAAGARAHVQADGPRHRGGVGPDHHVARARARNADRVRNRTTIRVRPGQIVGACPAVVRAYIAC